MAIFNKKITLSMDYSQFDGSITEINRKMKQLDSEFKLAEESMKSYATETDKVELEVQKLNEKITLQTKVVDKSKEAYQKAKDEGKATQKQLDYLKKAYLDNQVSLQKLKNSLIDTEDNLNKLKEAAEKADNEVDDLSDSTEDASKKMDSTNKSAVDYAATLYLLKEALTIVKDATSAYIDFDKSISKVNTIADTSAVSIGKLKEGVYNIAIDTGQSADIISEALYQCISANVKTTDALKVTSVAAKLAKTGFTDVATSVDVITTVMNAYNMSADQATTISDKLIQVQNLGKTTVGEFGDSFGKVAGLAKEANISLDEVLAGVATLTKVNGSASESITSLKAAISNIIKPSKEAQEMAKKLGISFNATSLQSKGFAGFLQDVQKKSRGNIETMAKLFGSVEALNSMLVLTGSGAESFASDLKSISGASGTTETALKKLDGTGNNFDESMNRLKVTLIQLGDTLSPIIDAVAKFVTMLSKIPKPVYVILGLLTALILVISNLTKIKLAWAAVNGVVSTSMGLLAGTTAVTTASMLKFLIAIAAIVAVIGLVVGSVKSIKSAMSEASSSTEQLTNSMNSIKNVDANVKTNYTTQYHASGTRDFRGGETWVGEAGPEKVILPRGSVIKSAEESNQGTTNIYNVSIEARNVKEFNDIVRLANEKKMANRRGVQFV